MEMYSKIQTTSFATDFFIYHLQISVLSKFWGSLIYD